MTTPKRRRQIWRYPVSLAALVLMGVSLLQAPASGAENAPVQRRIGSGRIGTPHGLDEVVSGVHPDPNTHNAALDTDLVITASGALSPTSVTTRTLFVHGGFHGHVDGSVSLSAGNTVVTYDPAGTFHPGELVQATVSTAVLDLGGTPIEPYVWQFRSAALGGSGSFLDSDQNLGNELSTDVALGDVDRDGDLDAYVTNYYDPDKLWLNDGSGIFGDSGQDLGNLDSKAVSLGDLDGDGDLDAFIVNRNGQPDKVMWNDGSGVFSDSGQSLGMWEGRGLALGDVDGDGDLDAFVANGGEPDKVWSNDGSGTFSDSGQNLGNTWSYAVALGDVDGDGDLDAFVANNNAPCKVWSNDGSGTFSDSGQNLGNYQSRSVALGDVDGDGDLDAFVANYSAQADKVWSNDGSGTFSDSGQNLGSSWSWDVALGDVDADGDLDAYVGSDQGGPDKVWRNDGSGTFMDSGQDLGSSWSQGVALGDVDGDGGLDAFIASYTPPNKVWLNQCAAGVTVEPPGAASSGDPGSNVGYMLRVTNTGACVDTFAVSLSGHSWPTNAPATVGPLGAGGGANLPVVVTVPTCTVGGAADTVTVTVTSMGDGSASDSAVLTTTANQVAPVANDDGYSTLEDTPLSVPAPGVLANDSDANCDPLSASLEAPPANGVVQLHGSGSFAYTPTLNYHGPDTFTYVVSDGALTDTATTFLTVTSVNDAPVAGDDAYTVTEDTALLVPAPGVLANDGDADDDPLSASLEAPPANGTVRLSPDGSFAYTPTLNYHGPDTFTYVVSDGVLTDTATVFLTVTSANDAPVANSDAYSDTEDTLLLVPAPGVLANDSDVDDDPLGASLHTPPAHGEVRLDPDGSFTYTPTLNFYGYDSFTYVVSDGLLTDTATVFLTVTAVPDYGVRVEPPSASQNGAPGTTVTYTLRVTNTGDTADTYTVAISDNLWPTGAPGTIGPLDAGAGSLAPVTVDIPSGANNGDLDVATVTLTSQGDGSTSASSTLTTTAVLPDIVVEPQLLTATLNPDQQATRTLHIGNAGSAGLTWSLAENPAVPWLDETPISGTVAPGDDVAVAVRFDAAGLGTGAYSSTLEISSNDPDEPLVVVEVTLVVTTACVPVYDAEFGFIPPDPLIGQLITFTGSADGSTPITFAWDFGDGQSGAGVTATHSYAAARDYLVTMTASNACGWQAVTATVTVITPCQAVSILSVTTSISGCAVDFGAVLGGDPPFAYAWDFGPYGWSSAPTVTIDFGGDGTYDYDLTVFSCEGRYSDTAAGQVTVACGVCAPVTHTVFTWTPLTPTVGQGVSFSGAAQGSTPLTFTWDFGDGGSAAGRVVMHSYAAAGTYLVTLTVQNPCGWDSAAHPVVVEPAESYAIYLPLVAKNGRP